MVQLLESTGKAGPLKEKSGAVLSWVVGFLGRTFGGIKNSVRGTGLYVHSSVLSWSECRRNPQGIRVSSSARVDLPISYQGSLLSTQFAAPLLELFSKIPTGDRRVRVCFSGEESFLRYFEMPLVLGKDQAGAIRFEMRKYSPFPVNEIYSGYTAVPDKAAKTVRVVFGGVKREIADHIFGEMKKSGVQVVGAEPAHASLWRLYLLYRTKEKKTKGGTTDSDASESKISMLVDIDEKGSVHTLIVRKGMPVLARHAHVKPLGLGLGVEPEQILPEVRLSYDYFSRSFKGEKIDGVVLIGGRGFEALPQLVEKELSLSCQSLLWEAGLTGSKTGGASSTSLDSRAYGASVGCLPFNRLAKIDLTEKRGVFPWEAPQMPPPEEKKFIIEWVAREGILIAAFVAIMTALAVFKVVGLEGNLARVKKSNAAVHAEFAGKPLEDLRGLETARIIEQGGLRRLFADVSVAEKMDGIASKLPDGFWLEGIEYSKGVALAIKGKILEKNLPDGIARVNRWNEALSSHEVFMRGLKSVNVEFVRSESSGEAGDHVSFGIKAKLT